jgi:death-on-curing protein
VTGRWLSAEDLLMLVNVQSGGRVPVRDGGILAAVTARPAATVHGLPSYPTPVEQAAAVLHAVVSWRPLERNNASLAWLAALVHLGRSGFDLEAPVSSQLKLVERLVVGELTSVDEVATRLAPYVRSRDGC